MRAGWLAGTGLVLLAAFVALGVAVAGAPPGIDVAVADALGRGWAGPPGRIAAAVGLVLGPALPLAASAVLIGFAVVSLRRNQRATAWVLTRCFALMWLCRTVSGLKPAFARERPRPYPDFAYPSGHVVSVACVALTAVVLCRVLAPRLTRRVAVVSAAAVLVTMLCRVVLDVHWTTDVVGAALGVTGLGLVAAVALGLLPVREGVDSRA